MPEPLTLQQLDNFLVQAGDRYPVQWIDNLSIIPSRVQAPGFICGIN
ncbi:hypothetical protein [Fischerella sp. PCC 9605]|nr:hypothetical protein [Fischerella sp. PCC 9605]